MDKSFIGHQMEAWDTEKNLLQVYFLHEVVCNFD